MAIGMTVSTVVLLVVSLWSRRNLDHGWLALVASTFEPSLKLGNTVCNDGSPLADNSCALLCVIRGLRHLALWFVNDCISNHQSMARRLEQFEVHGRKSAEEFIGYFQNFDVDRNKVELVVL